MQKNFFCKTKTLRIWRLPVSGAVFQQMLEFKESNSELTFHSYLLEEYEKEKESAKQLHKAMSNMMGG